jgi:hypothetical protein
MIPLSTLRDSFEGVIPSVIATLDAEGVPNVSYLSHVYYVDDTHVALSNQYFSKTQANVRLHGVATVMVIDARTGAQHLLDLQFETAHESGDLFEQMKAHLDVMSAFEGVGHLMQLRSADVYRVADCREVVAPGWIPPPPVSASDRLGKAAALAARIAAEDDADTILDTALDGLRDDFGFEHSLVLLPEADDGAAHRTLATVASRGYERYGAGAEVAAGEGLIGKVACVRRPIRIADVRSAQRYAAAAMGGDKSIPLPGLPGALCRMAVPMLAKGQLRGVIFVESQTPFAFDHVDEQVLGVITGQLALALWLAELQAQAVAPQTPPAAPVAAKGKAFRFKYFAFDDSVFIDDDYLIKGVPGRLLYHFVKSFQETGRRDFSNREIRRETALKLPDLKDNLETRLILLRRRLEDKGGPLSLTRPERGQIRLEVTGVPEIEVVEG